MPGKKDSKILRLSVSLFLGAAIVYICIRMMPRESSANPTLRTPAINERAGDTRKEELVLSEALKKKPDHSPVLMRLAQMSSAAGKHNEAIGYLKEILDREPENIDARLELGKALFESGNVSGAIAETENILGRQPEHADALYNLGAIYANLGESVRALEYWDRLFANHPKSASAQRARNLVSQLANKPNPSVANLNDHVSSRQ